MLKVNVFDETTSHQLDVSEQDLIQRRKNTLGPAYQLFYDHPLQFVKGEGAYLFDKQGNKYLDFYNNVASMGHSHPKIVEALCKQAHELCTHTRYLHEGIINYGERLLATMPAELANIMFTCTGSEANDLALRIAKDFTGGTGFIITEYAYHGITESIASLSPAMGEYVPIHKDARIIKIPTYDPSHPEQFTRDFVENVQSALKDMQRHGIKLAGILIDTLMTSDGVFAEPMGFFRPVIDLIHDTGGVFIADEVQPGFGRTGSHMWGFARHEIVPDIVTMGKPMGNGYPLAGLTVKPNVLKRFANEASYFNTFGGNPVAAAVGMAVLDVLEEESLMLNAKNIGEQLKNDLVNLSHKYPILGQVRGAGLFIAVDVMTSNNSSSTENARYIVNKLREEGILIGASGKNSDVLKIRPPLCISNNDAAMLIHSLDKVLYRI